MNRLVVVGGVLLLIFVTVSISDRKRGVLEGIRDALADSLSASRDSVAELKSRYGALEAQRDSLRDARSRETVRYVTVRESALADSAPTPETVREVVRAAEAVVQSCEAEIVACDGQQTLLRAEIQVLEDREGVLLRSFAARERVFEVQAQRHRLQLAGLGVIALLALIFR